jgi:hypothetical protein
MKIVRNAGAERVIDLVRPQMQIGYRLDAVTPALSLFAFSELMKEADRLETARLLLPQEGMELASLGGDNDRAARNQLRTRWLAKRFAEWLVAKVEVRRAVGAVPQSAMVLRDAQHQPQQVVLGSFAFSTEGLGTTPGNPLSLIQASETTEESQLLSQWFDVQWAALQAQPEAKQRLVGHFESLAAHRDPASVYALMLHQLFAEQGEQMDAATGIRETAVWKKLYKFQRDGVIGAIEKLDRFGGCIIADSVGLGKTFEALAVIKYYELRNDRVLVLVPKRLRDNWTLYKTNDRRNVLAADRLQLRRPQPHRPLPRQRHLGRDRPFPRELGQLRPGRHRRVAQLPQQEDPTSRGETRYDRLMRRIIKEGVKTRVLMLSATPVNNRLADLKNQIAFATEGNDAGMVDHGIPSIEATVRLAQQQFNRWQALPEPERRPARADGHAGLRLLQAARPPHHRQVAQAHPEVLRRRRDRALPRAPRPINVKPDVDVSGAFRSIREINDEIRRLHLAAYAPLALRPAGSQGRLRREVQHLGRGGARLLPPGRPRGEPDPPAAGELPQAHGERGGRRSR